MTSELSPILSFAGRLLISAIFFLNAFGVIDQSRPAQELASHGIPSFAVTPMVWAGRITQCIGGILLLSSRRFAAVGSIMLVAFLIPATLAAHDFWASPADLRAAQFVQFCKNAAIIGGLMVTSAMFIAKSRWENE